MDKKNKNPNVPNLRFSYKGDWSKRKLNEICLFFKGNGLSKSDLSNEGFPCILYGELYTTYKNEVISDIISKTNTTLSNPFLSRNNDLIIPGSGEDPIDIAVARAIYQNDIILGGDLNILRPKSNVSAAFLSYQLNGVRRYDIAKKAQGKSIVHLHNSDLKEVLVSIPSYDEQLHIVKLLTKIDEMIETQSKIIDSYFSLSKAISNTLIGQSKGNTRLRECLNCYSSNTMESVIKQEDLGDYPVYGANGIIKKINNYEIEYPSIAIVKDGSGVGKMFKLSGKYSILSTLNYLTSKPGYDIDYIYYALKQKSLKKYVVGSGIPHIYFKDYEQEKIYIPQNELQQQNITSVLQSIDEEIGNEIKQLKNYELLKKYLLKNMFV
ncbi:restriction endonuclease subunit S [Holdemanella biformis]|uniref:restriction endonuclease subunit S n=1 Tax=Holdemanella biformis TaxID=1735 RepID=UPI001C38A067|nr:restriction endonuclease subunit S [Holdemanella biformis]MBV4149859.1 restriction endonuclease subunit S [Holdemanella biformis]